MIKIRVYEVARELGLDKRELVTKIATLGIPVRNHMSSIEPADVDRVKRAIEKEKQQNVVEERIRPTVVRRRTVKRDDEPEGAGAVVCGRASSSRRPIRPARQPVARRGGAPAAAPAMSRTCRDTSVRRLASRASTSSSPLRSPQPRPSARRRRAAQARGCRSPQPAPRQEQQHSSRSKPAPPADQRRPRRCHCAGAPAAASGTPRRHRSASRPARRAGRGRPRAPREDAPKPRAGAVFVRRAGPLPFTSASRTATCRRASSRAAINRGAESAQLSEAAVRASSAEHAARVAQQGPAPRRRELVRSAHRPARPAAAAAGVPDARARWRPARARRRPKSPRRAQPSASSASRTTQLADARAAHEPQGDRSAR